MSSRSAAVALLLIAAVSQSAMAQKPRSAKAAADAFTLDSVAPADVAGDATVSASADAVPPAADAPTAPEVPAPEAPATDAATAEPGLDTPIGELIADKRTKAVLDRDLPGLSDDENLPKFRALSLRKFQPLTGGQLTDAMLATVGRHLADAKAAAPRRQTER